MTAEFVPVALALGGALFALGTIDLVVTFAQNVLWGPR